MCRIAKSNLVTWRYVSVSRTDNDQVEELCEDRKNELVYAYMSGGIVDLDPKR